MKNNPEHTPFGPSGCLSREGLSLFAQGKLSAQELAAVKAHLQTCEFCAFAAEGMAMADQEEFDQDLELIFDSLKMVNAPVPEVESKKSIDHQEFRKMPLSGKSFFGRYRLELIAAVILLLLAVGAIQIYVGLSSREQQSELARIEYENRDEMGVIHQEITRSAPHAEERLVKRPTPLKPVQISVVSDHHKGVSAFGAKPSNKNARKKSGSDAIEEERSASDADMEMQGLMEEEEGVEIFTVVEDYPEFPGGDKKRIDFLTANIKYPNEALEFGIEGTVYVGFVVEKDGSITDTRVLRGIGKGCEDEVLRVIRLMPKWKPGTQRRRRVRVQITLPITFTLA